MEGRREDEEWREMQVCASELGPTTPSLNSVLQTLSVNSESQSPSQIPTCNTELKLGTGNRTHIANIKAVSSHLRILT